MGDVGAFSSLVCKSWKGSGLEPHRRQWMMEGGQDRVWFKRTTKGGIRSEGGNKVRVPAFWKKVGH